MTHIRRATGVVLLLLLGGCTSAAPPLSPAPTAEPTPAQTATPTVPTTSAQPTAPITSAQPTGRSSSPTSSASATQASPAPTSPQPTATRTTSSPRASATKAPAAPTIKASCTLAVSDQTGDPLIRFTYRVLDPQRRGWVATLRYTNSEGTHTETVRGTGNKNTTTQFYGPSTNTVKPNCSATIKAR